MLKSTHGGKQTNLRLPMLHILKAKLKVNGGKLFSHTFSLNNKGKPIIR